MNEISRSDLADQQVAIAAAQPGSMLTVIQAAATNPLVDVTKMQALLEMQFKLEERQAERSFNQALARVTKGMPRIQKNGLIDLGVDKQSNKARGAIPFARWEDMDAIIRPRLEEEGFTLSFNSAPRQGDGGGAVVSGTLLHECGHSRTVSIPLPLDSGPGRNNLQAMGSTLSYGKRYCTEMLLNIVREGADDDGKSGGTRYITEAQADEVRALMKQAGRQEGAFLDRLFSGDVRSVEEIEAGALVVVKNTLDGIITQQAKKAQP
jgi:hypothetical protein